MGSIRAILILSPIFQAGRTLVQRQRQQPRPKQVWQRRETGLTLISRWDSPTNLIWQTMRLRHLNTFAGPGPHGFVLVGVKGGQLRRSNFSKP